MWVMKRLRRASFVCCCLLLAAASLTGVGISLVAVIKQEGPVGLEAKLSGRHLLTTANESRVRKPHPHPALSTPPPVHTSYIKLEGVDSIGHDLFVAYSASVAQLKAICTALTDCEGFNSEGWIKSRVSSKKRSVIDLYLKQTAILTPAPGEHTSDSAVGVYWDHLEDYTAMEQNFKIYMYETDIGSDMPSLEDYKYGVEQLFISLLAKSKFRTLVPEEATLFFLPTRCTAYRKSVTDLTTGIQVAAKTVGRMVEHVRAQYPYWNATLGADHFYICAHDMGTEVAKAASVGLWKNAIGLVNTADYSEPYFVAHKDVSLPPHPGRGVVEWALIGQGGAGFDPTHRTELAFMAGHPGRGIRPKIYEAFGDDPDFKLVRGYISDADYMTALKTSKFCLCPRGNKAWSPRLMDALWFGCVPVIVADHYVPPLQDLVAWGSIAVSVPERQVSSLKRILLSIPEQRTREMQLNIQKIYHHLTWNDPPQSFDAFHSVLYQLWQRRHVSRTHDWRLPSDSISYPLG